jgi:APA family basic amino acid/polyamine antiporter
VGLVISNMVGAGVFLSTGFMSQSMPPGAILLAWLTGAVLALAGTVAYAEVARLVPHSGGEYRYLSALQHPWLGYLSGWASLLVGFSAPIALDALAAGAFAHAAFASLDPRVVAGVLVVGLTAFHAVGLHTSARVQNGLVALKVALLVGFVAIGLLKGNLGWPTWTSAPGPESSPGAEFTGSLFYIAFAFSGWNAAIYASDEFKDPRRDVPRAMLIGCLAVAGLYLVVNYIFVANLTPADTSVVFHYDDFTSLKGEYDQVTLGQAVMAHLLGPGAARVMSAVMLLLFTSAISAMLLVGPRVYQAMARDGFLPRFLEGQDGKPPTAAVLLQGALALALLFTHDLRTILSNVGAVVVLFAALTVAGLFRARARAKTPDERPSAVSLAAATIYVLSSGWMFYTGFKRDFSLLGWVAAVAAVTLVAGVVMRRKVTPTAP